MSDTGSQSAGNEALIWLAGFFDGEGSACLAKRRTNNKDGVRFLPLLTITNTDKDTIEFIHLVLVRCGVGHHIIPYKSKKFPSAKKIYTVHINGFKRVMRFIDVIGKYCHTKRSRLDIVRYFIEYRLGLDNVKSEYGKVEFSLREQLQELNRFGSSETLRAAPLV